VRTTQPAAVSRSRVSDMPPVVRPSTSQIAVGAERPPGAPDLAELGCAVRDAAVDRRVGRVLAVFEKCRVV
jgi:hypothetical protein